MACIPVRIWLLPRLFSAEELLFRDGDDSDIAIAMAKKQGEKYDPSTVDEHPASNAQLDKSAKEDTPYDAASIESSLRGGIEVSA